MKEVLIAIQILKNIRFHYAVLDDLPEALQGRIFMTLLHYLMDSLRGVHVDDTAYLSVLAASHNLDDTGTLVFAGLIQDYEPEHHAKRKMRLKVKHHGH